MEKDDTTNISDSIRRLIAQKIASFSDITVAESYERIQIVLDGPFPPESDEKNESWLPQFSLASSNTYINKDSPFFDPDDYQDELPNIGFECFVDLPLFEDNDHGECLEEILHELFLDNPILTVGDANYYVLDYEYYENVAEELQDLEEELDHDLSNLFRAAAYDDHAIVVWAQKNKAGKDTFLVQIFDGEALPENLRENAARIINQHLGKYPLTPIKVDGYFPELKPAS